jgi:hypothetical protein
MSVAITINPQQQVAFPAKHGHKSKHSNFTGFLSMPQIQTVVSANTLKDPSNYICGNCYNESEYCICSTNHYNNDYVYQSRIHSRVNYGNIYMLPYSYV